MDSEQIIYTLNITSRFLDEDKTKEVCKAIHSAICKAVSEISKNDSPVFVDINESIETN